MTGGRAPGNARAAIVVKVRVFVVDSRRDHPSGPGCKFGRKSRARWCDLGEVPVRAGGEKADWTVSLLHWAWTSTPTVADAQNLWSEQPPCFLFHGDDFPRAAQ
jgi:hypothetical protein